MQCGNRETFLLLFENGIGVHTNLISNAIETGKETSEEEKLETIKMLSKIPELTTTLNV